MVMACPQKPKEASHEEFAQKAIRYPNYRTFCTTKALHPDQRAASIAERTTAIVTQRDKSPTTAIQIT
jgi:hypothetical protein